MKTEETKRRRAYRVAFQWREFPLVSVEGERIFFLSLSFLNCEAGVWKLKCASNKQHERDADVMNENSFLFFFSTFVLFALLQPCGFVSRWSMWLRAKRANTSITDTKTACLGICFWKYENDVDERIDFKDQVEHIPSSNTCFSSPPPFGAVWQNKPRKIM